MTSQVPTSSEPTSLKSLPSRPVNAGPARVLIAALLMVAACVLAYAPVLHGKFLWDDLYLVGANPFFKSPRFLLEVFRHYLFIDSFSLYYRPVQNLSYIADYAIWNQNELGYHLSNILYHAASACLLALVVRRCLRGMGGIAAGKTEGANSLASRGVEEMLAFSVGLIWAVHPIHNAAVAYIAGRADSIAMMCALAGWLLFLNEMPGRWRMAGMTLAPLCILTALCAKEIAFIWIALFTVYLLGFERGRTAREKGAAIASLLGVFAIYLWLRHLPGAREARQGVTYPEFMDRVILMLRALGDYTSLIFYPGNLHMERTVWNASAYSGPAAWQQALRGEYLSLLGLGTLALFGFACWSKLPGRKVRILGVTWFVLGFLPISNLFALNAQVAEHWIYMASAGYLVMLAGFASAIPARYHRRMAMALPVIVAMLGMRTAFRAADWADPETLYTQTIASGGFPQRVSLNLADVYERKGELKNAEVVLRATVAQFPDFPPARIQLGENLLRQGRKEEAARDLQFYTHATEQIATSTPQSWRAALQLAGVRSAAHDSRGAIAIMDEAIRRYPVVWDLVEYRAELLQVTQGPAAALPGVAEYAGRNWWHFDSHLAMAKIEGAIGDYPAALASCREAATLDIHNSAPYDESAKVELRANQLPEALDAQAAGIAKGPEKPGQYLMLAAILNEMHQPENAQAATRKANLLAAEVK